MAVRVQRPYRVGDPLSDLQLDALRYAAAGYTSTTAAPMMRKTPQGVLKAWHIARQKLGAATVKEAVKKAEAEGYSMAWPGKSKGVPLPLTWVRDWERADEFVEHWRGIPWHKARFPGAEHRCIPVTRGMVRVQGLPIMRISRCACGAADWGEGWHDRGSRRPPTAVRKELSDE